MKSLTFGVSVIACVIFQSAQAQVQSGIYVERYNGTTCDGWITTGGYPSRLNTNGNCAQLSNGVPNGSNISFTAEEPPIGQEPYTYRVFSVSPDLNIGNITVGGSAVGYTLLVGRQSTNPPFPDPTRPLSVAGGAVIGNISAPGGVVQVYSSNTVGSI